MARFFPHQPKKTKERKENYIRSVLTILDGDEPNLLRVFVNRVTRIGGPSIRSDPGVVPAHL
jgi:hypothetical protein